MQIMSLNAWGGTLADVLLPYIRDAAPDVLCVQEVVHSPSTDQAVLTYRDRDHVLPQRANLFRDISECLPDHVGTFCPAARGSLWDQDREVPSYWGLATFVTSALPVIGQVQGFVHKSYSHHGYGDHPRSRSAHGVRIWHEGLGRAIGIVHMHGLRDLAGKHDTPERRDQAMRLTDLSDALCEVGDLRIVCGDFNIEPGSETLDILRESGLTELVTDGGHSGTRSSHYKKPGRFADYMAVSDPHAVRRFEIVRDPEPSDHCPLIIEV